VREKKEEKIPKAGYKCVGFEGGGDFTSVRRKRVACGRFGGAPVVGLQDGKKKFRGIWVKGKLGDWGNYSLGGRH